MQILLAAESLSFILKRKKFKLAHTRKTTYVKLNKSHVLSNGRILTQQRQISNPRKSLCRSGNAGSFLCDFPSTPAVSLRS